MVRETDVARTLLRNGQKKRAILALQKKKYQITLIDKADGQLVNIDQMINSLEYAVVQQQVLAALKTGNDTLQLINSQMSIEDVEKLMQDSAEAVAHQDKISEMLTGQLTDLDEEAIEKELQEIEQAESNEEEKNVTKQRVEEKNITKQRVAEKVITPETEEQVVEVESEKTKPKQTRKQKQPVLVTT